MGDKQLQLFYIFLSFRPTGHNNLLFIKIPNTSQFTSFRNTTFSEWHKKRMLLKALSILNI